MTSTVGTCGGCCGARSAAGLGWQLRQATPTPSSTPRTPPHCAAGLTSVDLGSYVLGSWLGMLPGTAAYVAAGEGGRGRLVREAEPGWQQRERAFASCPLRAG